MTIKWTGDIASEALQEWAKKEITETAGRYEAFLKFFFTVSLSSIAAFSAILKLYKSSGIVDIYFYISMILYLASILVLVLSMLRRNENFDKDTVLYDEYVKDCRFYTQRMWAWFILWLAGILFSGLSIYL